MRLEAVWGGAKNHHRQRHQPGLVGLAIIHICAYLPPMNCTHTSHQWTALEFATVSLVGKMAVDGISPGDCPPACEVGHERLGAAERCDCPSRGLWRMHDFLCMPAAASRIGPGCTQKWRHWLATQLQSLESNRQQGCRATQADRLSEAHVQEAFRAGGRTPGM